MSPGNSLRRRLETFGLASPVTVTLAGGLLVSCLQPQPGEHQNPGPDEISGSIDPIVGTSDLNKTKQIHSAAAVHCTQAELLAASDRFDAAFECGDEHFGTSFNAIDGVGANVGNGQRFTRTPRADKMGMNPREWFQHIPARATGPKYRRPIASSRPSGSASAKELTLSKIVTSAPSANSRSCTRSK